MADPLIVATIIIYVIFLQPAIYVLFKHGRHGFLGWFYVQIFCILRIVGNASQISSRNSTSTKVLVLQSIGLSPLLLATAGILHEARGARNPNLRRKIEWFFVINYHLLVTTALILIIIGIVKLEAGDGIESQSIYVQVGVAVVIFCWALLCILSAVSLRQPKQHDAAAAVAFDNGTTLLYAAILALPLTGLRLAYAACTYFDDDVDFKTSLAAKVCLSVVPEMLETFIFIVAGIRTRNIWKVARGEKIGLRHIGRHG